MRQSRVMPELKRGLNRMNHGEHGETHLRIAVPVFPVVNLS